MGAAVLKRTDKRLNRDLPFHILNLCDQASTGERVERKLVLFMSDAVRQCHKMQYIHILG